PGLLRLAREQHADVAELRFEECDVFDLQLDPTFDIVTAARVLQWTEQPGLAVARMAAATRPGGRVVLLEYSHADLVWQPEPPPPVRRFYDGFLSWRTANGWDNRLADGLPRLLEEAGLVEVATSVEDEVAVRANPASKTHSPSGGASWRAWDRRSSPRRALGRRPRRRADRAPVLVRRRRPRAAHGAAGSGRPPPAARPRRVGLGRPRPVSTFQYSIQELQKCIDRR